MPEVPGHDPAITVLDTTRNILYVNQEEFDRTPEEERPRLFRVTMSTPTIA